MTVEIKQKLQGELDKLESELRVHLPKEIKRALEFGDLRENSEYQTALQRQTMVKARISDPAEGLISTVSPIGRSLMGKEEGDEVVVSIPSGSRRFEIRRLTTLHDEVK